MQFEPLYIIVGQKKERKDMRYNAERIHIHIQGGVTLSDTKWNIFSNCVTLCIYVPQRFPNNKNFLIYMDHHYMDGVFTIQVNVHEIFL